MMFDAYSSSSDDDAMETITKRLKEVSEMVTPKKTVETAMERMATPLREKVMEFSSITSHTFKRIRNRQRKHHRAFLRFRYAIYLVITLTRAFTARKKYFNARKKERRNSTESVSDASRRDTLVNGLQTIKVSTFKSSIGMDLQLYLANLPDNRDEKQIKRIIYYLRATKAFTMFSSEVEEHLARCVGYDHYDDGRIIAFQGRTPDRFYYVISGRIQLLRQYKLQTGVITKLMGTLRKGSVTDTEEIERQWRRQCNLVCKGMVEVLVLEKQDYFQLQNTIQGPPIEFLRSLELLRDFPLDIFNQHPEAIEYKYFTPDQLITIDTNQTKSVFIVKSGTCRCVRRQWVTDITKDRRFNAKQGIDKLGYVKASSHAEAMLGTGWKRMVMNGQMNSILPQIPKIDVYSNVNESVSNPHRSTLDCQKPLRDYTITNNCWSSATAFDRVAMAKADGHDTQMDDNTGTLKRNVRSMRAESIAASLDIPALALPAPDIGTTNKCNDSRRNELFMTQRARTDVSILNRSPKRKGNLLEAVNDVRRLAYLQVDTLHQGDIFGLNDIVSETTTERSGIPVWSEGAEIVAINKRFFKNNASLPTMLRVDMLIRDWMSEKDASERLEAQETWQEYKVLLMERMAADKAKSVLTKSLTTMYFDG